MDDEERKRKRREYYERTKEARREQAKAYYWRNRDARVAYQRTVPKEVQRGRSKANYRKIKAEVYSHYGSVCACCGESELLFLTLDHINGGGFQHRKTVGGGLAILYDIKKRGFPPEFQVLCFNCNQGRQLNGGICPHRE
jgi:hypothetical protein